MPITQWFDKALLKYSEYIIISDDQSDFGMVFMSFDISSNYKKIELFIIKIFLNRLSL